MKQDAPVVSNRMVMRNSDYAKDLDDFPTPPWATRALLNYLPFPRPIKGARVLEPACGRGYMSRVLYEAGARVTSSDVAQYDGLAHRVSDYAEDFDDPFAEPKYDYVITNPPFKLAERFARRALVEAKCGVALILRTLWLDTGIKRYEFLHYSPPNLVLTFAGRMDAKRGGITRKNGSFMSHSIFWWDQTARVFPGGRWLGGLIAPDAQRQFERDADYDPEYLKWP